MKIDRACTIVSKSVQFLPSSSSAPCSSGLTNIPPSLGARSATAWPHFFGGRMAKRKVTKQQLQEICDRIAEGESLTRICNNSEHLPSWRTMLRYVQDDEDAYSAYRRARALQCEVMRDQILDLVEAELPTDPKLAMAEVQRRRLEAGQGQAHKADAAARDQRQSRRQAADQRGDHAELARRDRYCGVSSVVSWLRGSARAHEAGQACQPSFSLLSAAQ